MTTARQILGAKGGEVWSVGPDTTVLETLRLLADKGIGAVVVMDDERLAGIFTERDYARKVVLAGRSSKEARISEVMTPQVVCVAPERSVDECLALMTDKRVRHLPVVEHKKVIGLVSIGDLVKAKIADHEHTIEQLQSYITGQF